MSEIALINFLSSNACVIDLENYVTLGSYKNSAVKKHNVSLLKNELLLLGDGSKSLLHVFKLNKWEEDLSCKVILPAKATAIASSYDGCFVTIAMGNEIMVWQPASNLFVKCPKTHYQQVTVVRYTKDGSKFITAGDDGMVIVWNLSKVLSTCDQTNKSCALVFSDHQLPVTDVNVSQEIHSTYLLSTSMDRTCRIYDLNSKTTVLKIVFESVMSVGIFSDTKHCAFLGDTNGNIFKVILSTYKNTSNEVFENQMKDLQKFSSVHTREVTSLVITANNMKVISGGLDKLLVIWNSDGQALKVLQQTSEITNITLSISTCLNIDKEYSMENPIKSLNRTKCDINNHYMELYTQKQKQNNSYFIGKSKGPSVRNSVYKLEEDNITLKQNNAKIFEHCKMLIGLNDGS